MVYKVEKHGVRTGNSFKRWNTKYYRDYRKHAYIIRSHNSAISGGNQNFEDTVRFQTTSAFGEGSSMIDGVEYSLNKQRRWDLPQILEDIILNNDHDEDYGIQLVERHRINRYANCINVCSTDGVFWRGDVTKDRKFKTKNCGGYFQSNSVLKRAPVKKCAPVKRNKRSIRSSRRRRPQPNEESEEVNEEPQETYTLRYEVHYPSPVTSYLTHNAKFIGIDTYPSNNSNIFRDKNSGKRRRGKMHSYIKESLSCMDDCLEDSDEESIVHDTRDTDCGTNEFNLTLDDVLKHACTVNKLTGGKSRHNSSNRASSCDDNDLSYRKGQVIYIEGNETEGSDSTMDKAKSVVPSRQTHPILQPVRVTLSCEEISPQTLTQTFGKAFIDCECFPRKFILNISDKVTQMDICKTDLKHSEACIVFIHDIDNESNNLKENVYKVFLNAKFGGHLNSVKIETIFDYMETTVVEIIERTVFFIETLPVESIVCENDSRTCKSSVKETFLESCAKWSTGSYLPDNAFLLDSFVAHVPEMKDAVDMGYELVPRFDSFVEDDCNNIASPNGRFCSICYTSLDNTNPGTALMSCGHWFCDNCWQEYLEMRLNTGALDFRCPEYDCNKLVDPGTVLSLINMRDVLKHAQCCHDTQVEQQKTTRWCPNEKCDRVLERNCEDATNSECICGYKVCFECLESPHWPASCESVKNYYKKMRDNGDISIEPPESKNSVVVRGKHCPACKRFVEKDGGCPSMICVCNANFCWGCNQLWGSRTHDECYKYGRMDSHNTTKVTLTAPSPLDRKNRQKWYKMALVHRSNQHGIRLWSMKSHIKSMTKQLQHYLVRAERRGDNITLDTVFQNRTFNRESEKVPCFLRTTIDLYAEINHVLENTSVLLNSEQLPGSDRLVLQCISSRLSTFSDIIYELFTCYETIPPKVVLDRLKDVWFHSRKTMQSLIRCIKAVKK